MKKVLSGVLLFSLAGISFADIIFLNKGDEINCKVVGLSGKKITAVAGGRKKTYDVSDVLKVQFVKEYSPRGSRHPEESAEVKELIENKPSVKKYPNAGYLNALRQTRIKINKDRSYTVSRRFLRYVLRERGKNPAGRGKVYFFPETEDVEINYAYSMFGEKISYLNDISMQRGGEYSFFPEYDRLKSIKFSVPDIKVGSVVDFKYKVRSKYNPYMPFYETVFFRFYEPAEKVSLKVIVPRKIQLVYKAVNMPEDCAFSIKRKGANKIYSWVCENMPPYLREPMSPPYIMYAPHVNLSIKEDWSKVKERFAAKLSERLAFSENMKKKTEELIEGKETSLQKAEALYNWVASLRTAYVPASNFSFLPRKSSEIFESKVGNYLDKPFLFYAMLKLAGLDARFAYVQNKEHSDFDSGMANVRQFFAGEVLFENEGKTFYMMPIRDNARYMHMPRPYQGAAGITVLGKGGELLFKNPLHAPSEELYAEESSLALNEDGDLNAVLCIIPGGESQEEWRGLKDKKRKEIEQTFENYVYSLHPNARLEKYEIENLNDKTKDIKVKVYFKAEDYALKAADKFMLVKIPGIEVSAWHVGQEKRSLGMYWGIKNKTTIFASMTLPEGFSLYYAPGALKVSDGGETYHAEYSFASGMLKFNYEKVRDRILLKNSKYAEYKKLLEKVSDFTKEWIVLKKD